MYVRTYEVVTHSFKGQLYHLYLETVTFTNKMS